MLSIPGLPGATCDGVSRRELLRVGGAGLLGISLANLLQLEAIGAPTSLDAAKRSGFGTAKNFIFVFLQGGPSHLDIWDPKPEAPDNIRGDFKPIQTKIPGVGVSEVLLTFALFWLGVPFTPALLGVLSYRIFNFWLALLPAFAVSGTVRRIREGMLQAERELRAGPM